MISGNSNSNILGIDQLTVGKSDSDERALCHSKKVIVDIMEGIDRVDIIQNERVINEKITKGDNFVEVPIHNGLKVNPQSKG